MCLPRVQSIHFSLSTQLDSRESKILKFQREEPRNRSRNNIWSPIVWIFVQNTMLVMLPPSYFSEDDCSRFVIRDLSHSQAGRGGGEKEAEPIRGLLVWGF